MHSQSSRHEPYTGNPTRLRCALVVVCAVATLLSVHSAPAFGDGGGRPVGVVEVPSTPNPQGSPGNPSTQAVPTGRSYRCDEAGTLRRAAGSYVIGWCTVGMHLDISSNPVGSWQAGWGEGNYKHCGWFLTTHDLTPSGVYDHNCGATTYVESHFANAINSSPGDDGAPVPIFQNCTRYANVQPWVTGSTAGNNAVGTVLTTDTFRWRYLSKNNQWVLGRMTRPNTSVYYDWIFVSASCVGTPATRPPSTTS